MKIGVETQMPKFKEENIFDGTGYGSPCQQFEIYEKVTANRKNTITIVAVTFCMVFFFLDKKANYIVKYLKII